MDRATLSVQLILFLRDGSLLHLSDFEVHGNTCEGCSEVKELIKSSRTVLRIERKQAVLFEQ